MTSRHPFPVGHHRDPIPAVDRLDLWQTFVRIVEAGNLTAAARQFNTTQPTISRRLKLLEQLTEMHLIQRSTHSLRLTLEGESCYERVKRLLTDWEGFESELRIPGSDPGGTLRMVVPHAFGQEKLIGPLVDFLERHTRISVEWILHDDPRHFIAAGIDCAIKVGEIQDPNLVTLKLAQVPRIVVAAPSVAGATPPPETIEQLAAMPWLAFRTYYHSEVTLVHAITGMSEKFRIHPRFSTDNLYALRSAAVQGLGACLGSAWIFAEDLAQGRLIQPLPMWCGAPLPLNLVYPYAPSYPARLRRFVEFMRKGIPEILGSLTESPSNL